MKLNQINEEFKDTLLDHNLLNLENLQKYVEENCKVALASSPIYRGFKSNQENVYLIDPKKHERKSANTSNYYTIIIDHIISNWKKYPKRSRSLICSTASNRAAGYGYTYRVFPLDGAKIGVCPKDDFWVSFSNPKKYGISGNMDYVNRVIKSYLSVTNGKLIRDTYEDIRGAINYIERMCQKDEMNFSDLYAANHEIVQYASIYDHELFELNRHVEKHCIEYVLEDMFDPEKNDFKLITANSKFNIEDNHEVWTDSKSVLVKYDLAREMF